MNCRRWWSFFLTTYINYIIINSMRTEHNANIPISNHSHEEQENCI